MTPYYEQDGIVIYHGDCRDVLPSLGRFDLLLTDPPYGLDYARSPIVGKGLQQKYARSDWDELAPEAIALARSMCREQVIWGGNYYNLPPARCWLVWHKPDAVPTAADCEMAWTNFDKPSQHITWSIAATNKERVGHPTQKPEAVIAWALQHATNVSVVCDPFMGSGTTLVAAKRIGKQAIGVERDEKFCEIAAKRLAQGALPMEFSA